MARARHIGALGLGVTLVFAGCTAGGEPATPPSSPAGVVGGSQGAAPGPTASSVVGPGVGVLERAERLVELPIDVTRAVDLPFVGTPRVVPGGIRDLTADGDVITEVDLKTGRFTPDGHMRDVVAPFTIGPGAEPDGGVGDTTGTAREIVWLAFPNVVDDLNVADFEVYVDPIGPARPRSVASSTPDIPDQGTGRNVAVPLWRERPLVLGERVLWSETVRRAGDIDVLPAADAADELGVAVRSAALDGSGDTVETAAGWYPSADLCSADDRTLVYVDSALAQAPRSGTATLRRAVIGPDGAPASDEVVWRAAEPAELYVAGAAACGDTVAVAWRASTATSEEWSAVEIVHDGVTTVIEIPLDGRATRPIVTNRLVTFEVGNGDLDASDFVYDLPTGKLYRISANTGRPDSVFANNGFFVWIDVDVLDEDGAEEVGRYIAPIVR